jgi:hypothetical protein
MNIDLKPTPVLQELIQDLENKLNAQKLYLVIVVNMLIHNL